MYTLYAQTPDDKALFLLCRYNEGWALWHAEKFKKRLLNSNPKQIKGLHLLGPDNKMVWSFALGQKEASDV